MKITMNFHIISSIILIHFFVILLNAKQIDNSNSNPSYINNNNNSNVYNNSNVIILENHSQEHHHLHSHHHRHNSKHNKKDNNTRELLRNSLINHTKNDRPLALTVASEKPHPKMHHKIRRNNKKLNHLKTTTARVVHNPKSEKFEDEFDDEYVGRDLNNDYEFHNGVEPRINAAPSTSSSFSTTSSSSSSSSSSAAAATPYIKSTTPTSENRICANAKIVNVPFRTTEVYNKPVYRHYSEPCHNNGQVCSGVRLVHEPIVRTVVKYRKSKQVVYTCCNGWEKLNEADTGCNKPICTKDCRNNGKCVRPDTCECATGFTGIFCEKDINECMEEKPCDQYCFNTEGSYYCTCRDGFTLHTDKQSCKKQDYNPDEDALEARDLETNDIDDFNYDDINARLEKIENILASERFDKINLVNNIEKKFTKTLDSVNNLQQRIDVIEHKQQDIKDINEKIRVYDDQAKRIEHVMDLLFKCRTKSSIYCP